MAQPNPPTTKTARRMQAIANTAGFHFGFIEQGGSSLYPTLAQGVEAAADRKSTRLNSSHTVISYAVFCLKKKNSVILPILSAAMLPVQTCQVVSDPATAC